MSDWQLGPVDRITEPLARIRSAAGRPNGDQIHWVNNKFEPPAETSHH